MSEQQEETGTREDNAMAPLAPLYAALAKAQASFGTIERNRTVKVRPRKRDDGYQPPEYTFDYAPLEEVLTKCLPALNANGLALFHRLDLATGQLVTTLAHSSGATIDMAAPVPRGDWQSVGSAVTYARRYTVQCILGVAAEYDDDGSAADGNAAEPIRDRKPARTQPTPPAAPTASNGSRRQAEPRASFKPAETMPPPTQPEPDMAPDEGPPPDDLDEAVPVKDMPPPTAEDSVDDAVKLAKGPTTALMGALMQAAGFSTKEQKEGYAKSLLGSDAPPTYGTARAVIRQLWKEGYRV